MAASAVVCFGQSNPSFSYKTSGPGARPTITLSADLNNDGFPDLIEDSAYAPIGFTVQLANGDGTFKAPVFHSVSGGSGAPAPIAVGDFNNDGKADVAVPIPGKNQVAVYLGNGDGTFQAPKYSTITLNSGQTFASVPVVAANFNTDGDLDLAVVGVSGNNQSVYVLQGDGTGGFNTPHDAINLPAYYVVQNMVTGDFDGDAKADLFFTGVFGCGTTGSCTTNVYGLFGDGNFGFEITTPYSSYDTFQISAGDLDSDGRTDLIGYDPATQQVIAFYGQADRTIASYSWTIANVSANANFADGWSGPFQIGDFNGDGHMDIVGHFTNNVKDGTDYELMFFLGTANRGQFTSYFEYLPASSMPVDIHGTAPVTADENGDGKPDIVVYQTPGPAATGPSDNAPLLVTALDTTGAGNWGGCTYLNKAQGIHLCSPTNSSSSPVSFKAAATSFGQLRKIELWVDGKKLAENFHAWEHNAWFNYTGSFAAGSHQATLFAADLDNRLQRLNYTFTVGAGCAAPSSYGVHVCSPANGSTVSSPVTVQAAAKIAGTLARMEVWVDGVKKYSETTSTSLSTSISLAAGTHRFDIYAVNTAGTKYVSTVTATVK
jgi:hypothetical protein